ncbi:hypothetical protein OS493_030380 [Desmophyllum pertusum]|uniref:Uncharacterized protein n=1 Tax=Desmophyllum pertusum TaxID=174260 RepID=A0A9W9Z977_9CNID|nr:hypothetical protein OS493_030380 [Desmophyllum pertusum]
MLPFNADRRVENTQQLFYIDLHPAVKRLYLHHQNVSQRAIAQQTPSEQVFVQKVVVRYDKENKSLSAVKTSTSGPVRKIYTDVLE